MESSDTMLTASSSPIRPTFTLPSDSRRAKGATVLLRVTQHDALLKSTLRDLTNVTEKCTVHESIIHELQMGHQKMSKDLQKAHQKIQELDD